MNRVSTTGSEFFGIIKKDWESENGVVINVIAPFFVALFAAFFGAFFAASLNSRREARREAIADFERTYNIATKAAELCNSGLSLKRQNLSSMYNNYFVQLAKTWKTIRKGGSVNINYDLNCFSGFEFDCSYIRDEISYVSRRGSKDFAHAAALNAAINNINSLVEDRNKWIEEERASTEFNQENGRDFACKYFGFQNNDKYVDQMYKHYVKSIYHSNEDIIFHSYFYFFKYG